MKGLERRTGAAAVFAAAALNATIASCGSSSDQAVKVQPAAASSPSTEPPAGTVTKTADGMMLHGPFAIPLDHQGYYSWQGKSPLPYPTEPNDFAVSYRLVDAGGNVIKGGAGQPRVDDVQARYVQVPGGYVPAVSFTVNDTNLVGDTLQVMSLQMGGEAAR